MDDDFIKKIVSDENLLLFSWKPPEYWFVNQG